MFPLPSFWRGVGRERLCLLCIAGPACAFKKNSLLLLNSVFSLVVISSIYQDEAAAEWRWWFCKYYLPIYYFIDIIDFLLILRFEIVTFYYQLYYLPLIVNYMDVFLLYVMLDLSIILWCWRFPSASSRPPFCWRRALLSGRARGSP